tara:strand:+ start:1164 stop:1913 length:750 start_codon:yes stop_codon:yes gene_type:complete
LANGLIIYEGPSELDPAVPIVVIATFGSNNRKTGSNGRNMIQTWIMRQDIAPWDAKKQDLDKAVCGDVPCRAWCYVFRGPLDVWKAYKRGSYDRAEGVKPIAVGRDLRIGSYGDPSAVPMWVWIRHTRRSNSFAGYSHHWRTLDPKWKRFVMASVETPWDAIRANALGWRTFRVKLPEEPVLGFELPCPASEEMNKILTCVDCGQCDGINGGANRPSRVINAHGPVLKRYRAWRDGLGAPEDWARLLNV